MIKKIIFLLSSIGLIVGLFTACKTDPKISIKVDKITYEKTFSASQIMADDYFSLLFGDIIETNSSSEYDLYSFELKIRNGTDFYIASCYNNKIINDGNKEYLVTKGRDLKSSKVLFSPENKYLGLSERYSIPAHKSEVLDYYMLLKTGEKPKFKAVYCILIGENKEYAEIPVSFN